MATEYRVKRVPAGSDIFHLDENGRDLNPAGVRFPSFDAWLLGVKFDGAWFCWLGRV